LGVRIGLRLHGALHRATGYALTAQQNRPGIEVAITRNDEIGVGACRF
jgi:hypothetical protein